MEDPPWTKTCGARTARDPNFRSEDNQRRPGQPVDDLLQGTACLEHDIQRL